MWPGFVVVLFVLALLSSVTCLSVSLSSLLFLFLSSFFLFFSRCPYLSPFPFLPLFFCLFSFPLSPSPSSCLPPHHPPMPLATPIAPRLEAQNHNANIHQGNHTRPFMHFFFPCRKRFPIAGGVLMFVGLFLLVGACAGTPLNPKALQPLPV